jgi:hypothetical protein
MQNIVDLRLHDNQELAIRFNTNVKNGRVFYTDLNGFDMRCVPTGATAESGFLRSLPVLALLLLTHIYYP